MQKKKRMARWHRASHYIAAKNYFTITVLLYVEIHALL